MENFYRLAELTLLAAGAPVIDTLAVEAPVTPDPKSGDLLLSEQAVDRARMDMQVLRNLNNRHHFVIFLHQTTIRPDQRNPYPVKSAMQCWAQLYPLNYRDIYAV